MKRHFKSISRFAGAVALAFSATAGAEAQIYEPTVLTQNPPAYYPLTETAQITTPPEPTNTGTLGTAVTSTYTGLNPQSYNVPGPLSGTVSLALNGSSYVTTSYASGENTTNFTFETWAQPASASQFDYLAASAVISSPRSGWYFAQDNGGTFGDGNAWVSRLFYGNGTTPLLTVFAPVTGTNWTHLVLTFNGTTASIYTNGVLGGSTTIAAGLYQPNQGNPFTIGARSDLGFPWPGNVAESALYTKTLSAARVAAHYAAGTGAAYVSAVQADAPVVFYQYQAPPQPVAVNAGTLGSAANGIYGGDVVPGGIPGPTNSGFPAGISAPLFSGNDAGSGSVSLPDFNFNTNVLTISGWVNANTSSEEAGAGIVVTDGGTTDAGLIIDDDVTFGGGLGLGYVWNNDPGTYNVSFSETLGLPTLNEGEWDFVALVVETNQAEIYIASPTIGFTSATNYYPNAIQTFATPTTIGIDPGNTNGGVPTVSFSGGISSVGIWSQPLSSGQLYSEYASAVGGLAPKVFGGPLSPSQPIVQGNPLSLTVNSGGTPNLSYQWFSNNVAIFGATSNVYTKPVFNIASDSGNYFVIVTNLYGSATSAIATVTGQLGTAPVIVSAPASNTVVYPGGVVNLTIVATGGGLSYQWTRNGTVVPGLTGPIYATNSVSTNFSGSYVVSVTNSLGKTNVSFVLTVPVLATNSYAGVVNADAPEGWWRLNDPSAATGALLNDVTGRHPGAYTNFGGLTLGAPSAVHGGIAGSSASFNGDGSFGYVPYFTALSGPKFSLEAWVEQTNVVNDVVAVSAIDASGNGEGIAAESYWQGITSGQVFGQGPGVTAGYDPTIYPSVWTHVVIEYNPLEVISGTAYPYEIYVNGVNDGYIWGANPLDSAGPLIIGGKGTGTNTILSQYFVGRVQEVAFYSFLLSAVQIQNHYKAAYLGVPPSFSLQPLSQSTFVGGSATFTVEATGLPTITYQWLKDGVDLPGQTNTTLTVSNLFYTAASDVYSVIASNSQGSTVSSNAYVSVFYPPTYANLTNGLVLHLPFDGNYNDTSGQGNDGTPEGSPTFVPGVIGADSVDLTTIVTNSIYNYVSLGNPADLQFGTSQNFTVSYWAKLPAGEAPIDLPFFDSAVGSTTGFGITIAPGYETGGWGWSLANSSGTYVTASGPNDSINDGKWHNVVTTFNRTGDAYTYLDGQLVDSTPIAGIGDIDTGGGFTVGQDPTGTYNGGVTNAFATFDLDDLAVWTNALTTIQAESIYIVGSKYGASFNTDGPATATIYKLSGNTVGIAWQGGTLEKSGSVNGPWTPVPGATAPFYQIPVSTTNVFYEVGPH